MEKLEKIQEETRKAVADLDTYLSVFSEPREGIGGDFFFDYMTGRIAGLRFALKVLESE